MRTFWREDSGIFTATPGTNISDAVDKAIKLAADFETFSFEFNGITVNVNPDSDRDIIVRDYYIAGKQKKKVIGPYESDRQKEMTEIIEKLGHVWRCNSSVSLGYLLFRISERNGSVDSSNLKDSDLLVNLISVKTYVEDLEK